MKISRTTLYARRRLSERYPNIEQLYDEAFNQTLADGDERFTGVDRQLDYLNRLVDVEGARTVVVGCGPQPRIVKHLVDRGYDAFGVEPVPAFVREAGQYLGAPERVLEGAAESIPLPPSSVQLVYCNSVLEHVDSPLASLREMARVLRPGGAAFVITTNRYRVSLRGDNGEFNLPFFNWLPEVVKECFVFQQLHYDPKLANYSDRPAVHWFSWSQLCQLGRDAGFAHFYSTLDLLDGSDAPLAGSALKRWALAKTQCNPWLRALVLTTTYFGGMVVMLKRNVPVVAVVNETDTREAVA